MRVLKGPYVVCESSLKNLNRVREIEGNDPLSSNEFYVEFGTGEDVLWVFLYQNDQQVDYCNQVYFSEFFQEKK